MKIFTLFVLLITSLSNLIPAQDTNEVDLEKYKRIDKPARDEVSGIVKDPRFSNVFWVHGDSGTDNRIYAINDKGELVKGRDAEGHEITDFKNEDWEDIAISEKGTIYLADIGNNCSCRTDQSIIVINDLNPEEETVGNISQLKIKYQKPDGFLYRFLNYSMDAEALFTVNDEVYVLTKRFRGKETKLFKLFGRSTEEVNEFRLVKSIDFDDEVTASDFAFNKLAVLTYRSLWIFEQDDTPDFFDGKVTRYTFDADQVESVTFVNESEVMIAEENGDLYRIKLNN